MKLEALSLLALAISSTILLGEDAPTIRLSSDKQHAVVISHDRFTLTIQDAGGKKLFSSRDIAELQTVTEFNPDHVLWSPDGRAVAVAGGDPRFMLTYVFIHQGSTFIYAPVPTLAQDYDNPWIVPVKWTDKSMLSLQITGPHAGKAVDGGYHGEAKIRVSVAPPKCEKITERIATSEK